jgi:hypothetical protein
MNQFENYNSVNDTESKKEEKFYLNPKLKKLFTAFLTSVVLTAGVLKAEAQTGNIDASPEKVRETKNLLVNKMKGLPSYEVDTANNGNMRYSAKLNFGANLVFEDINHDGSFSKGDKFWYTQLDESTGTVTLIIDQNNQESGVVYNDKNPNESGIEGAKITTISKLGAEAGINFEADNDDAIVAGKILSNKEEIKILHNQIVMIGENK